jgi:hypothetical protein
MLIGLFCLPMYERHVLIRDSRRVAVPGALSPAWLDGPPRGTHRVRDPSYVQACLDDDMQRVMAIRRYVLGRTLTERQVLNFLRAFVEDLARRQRIDYDHVVRGWHHFVLARSRLD